MNNSQRKLKKVNAITLSTKHLYIKTGNTVLKKTVFIPLATCQIIYYRDSQSSHEKQYVIPIYLFY